MEVQTRNTAETVSKQELLRYAMENPVAVSRALNDRSLFHFLEYFWDVVSAHSFHPNWHIEFLCHELETVAQRVGDRRAREYDMIINVPPGTTKTITCSIMYPVWCWTRWPWMRFICASYSNTLSLESAEYCRDLIRSQKFREMYPDLDIRDDKDTKSNFKIVKKVMQPGMPPKIISGGSRYSTSVGGTLTGFHGDILIVDDPLNPNQAVSELELAAANRWCEQTLSTRKTDKAITPTIFIMQRLHQDDPAGHILSKRKENIRHICLPGDARRYKEKINPPELYQYYKDDLLDPVRLPWKVLEDLEADLGQYGYAGQIGQDPTPPGGGMFKVGNFEIIDELPHPSNVLRSVRYWDKAGSKEQGSAFTVGVKMLQLMNGRWIIEDVRRGRWTAERREAIVQETARMDGTSTIIWLEQEPGSGGKESAQASILGLAGFIVYAERPTGDKTSRADSYSVQVNNGGIRLLKAPWNRDFIEEHRFFPFSTYKDQVDAAAGAFNKLVFKKLVRRIT